MRQRQIDRHAIFVGQAWLADNDRAEIFCHFFCHIVAGGVNEITRYGSDFEKYPQYRRIPYKAGWIRGG